MKRELKVGQRVRVYESSGIWDGTVENVNTKIGPGVTVEFKDGPRGFTRTVFAEQCRRLRKRERSEKRERVAIEMQVGFHRKLGWVQVAVGEEENYSNVKTLRLVECAENEVVISRESLAKAWEKGRVQDGKIDFADAERSKHFADMCRALGIGGGE